ncbi:PinR Site-specific recombinases, DNA invertase Pin homologs [uncultured Caudovirales phage]|uniref:PinR Site-specific recombinases, DNA invertase Pin homologs n=1 Tax=uncultured Caudovirales phage TaxID=2100421 RepID=A0A6J5KYX6_9CAUD|nr:PinR Site-specific recombinases, DNA invertase Pin homologs [uncultured Caudovirales phage]
MKIGYARISTRDQSLELQVDALKAAGCEKIYQEVASGVKTARLVLDDLMKNLRSGDTLIIWKLDRLGRNLVHLRQTVEELKNREVTFISLSEEINTTTAQGMLFFNFFGMIAEFERGMIVERVNAGLKSARARGKLGGRPKGLSGHAIDKAKIAESLYKDKSLSIRTICSQLGIGLSTFYRYLRFRGVDIGSSPIKKIIQCQN